MDIIEMVLYIIDGIAGYTTEKIDGVFFDNGGKTTIELPVSDFPPYDAISQPEPDASLGQDESTKPDIARGLPAISVPAVTEEGWIEEELITSYDKLDTETVSYATGPITTTTTVPTTTTTVTTTTTTTKPKPKLRRYKKVCKNLPHNRQPPPGSTIEVHDRRSKRNRGLPDLDVHLNINGHVVVKICKLVPDH